tara:strand:+ start:713 stop:1489 length:777 start_codon:yes stop_codon:yes gene_type:complete
MYKYIINPTDNTRVVSTGIAGKKILNNYIKELFNIRDNPKLLTKIMTAGSSPPGGGNTSQGVPSPYIYNIKYSPRRSNPINIITNKAKTPTPTPIKPRKVHDLVREFFPQHFIEINRKIDRARVRIVKLEDKQRRFRSSVRYLQFKRFWPKALQTLENTSPEFTYSSKFKRVILRRVHLTKPPVPSTAGKGPYFHYVSKQTKPHSISKNINKTLHNHFDAIINTEDGILEKKRVQIKTIELLNERLAYMESLIAPHAM